MKLISGKTGVVYLVLLTLVLALMVRIRNNRPVEKPDRDFPEIQEEGVLRLVTEYNRDGYYITENAIEGFHYELSQAIAQISGLEVRVQLEMSLAESFNALDNQVTDIVARNIPVTTENREHYLFTDPVILNKQVLIQRTAEANEGKAPIRNQLLLGGEIVYIPQDSPALLRLTNLAEEIGDSIHIVQEELYSTEQLLILVARGEIDYAVGDLQTCRKYIHDFPGIDIDTDISFTQLQSWAVRQSSPILLDSLNSWFNHIRLSGQYDRIYRRYYP